MSGSGKDGGLRLITNLRRLNECFPTDKFKMDSWATLKSAQSARRADALPGQGQEGVQQQQQQRQQQQHESGAVPK